MDENQKIRTDIQRYLDKVTHQYRVQPNFMRTLRAILWSVDGIHTSVQDLPDRFDVWTAVGEQLDILGQLVGIGRQIPALDIPGYDPVLTDDLYRILIMAKIAQNQWNGTNETFQQMLDDTIGKWVGAVYKDNQDMTITFSMEGTIDPVLIELINRGIIMPKPDGVGMNVEVTEHARTEEYAENPAAILTGFSTDEAEINVKYGQHNWKTSARMFAGSAFPTNEAIIEIRHAASDRSATAQMLAGSQFGVNQASMSFHVV